MVGILESDWAIIIIAAVVLLVFGGSQLPKLARSLGSAQSEFKKGLADGKAEGAASSDAKASDAKSSDAKASDAKAVDAKAVDATAPAGDGEGSGTAAG